MPISKMDNTRTTDDIPPPAFRPPLPRLHRVRPIADRLERFFLGVCERRAAALLRWSVGVVFIWFGAPKFVSGLSPAEPLVVQTTEVLTFGLLAGHPACLAVAVLEVLLGLVLLSGRLPRTALVLFLGHMVGTATPLLLFPGLTWKGMAIGTMEGQYIIKNVVLVTAVAVSVALSRSAGAAAAAPARATLHQLPPQPPAEAAPVKIPRPRASVR